MRDHVFAVRGFNVDKPKGETEDLLLGLLEGSGEVTNIDIHDDYAVVFISSPLDITGQELIDAVRGRVIEGKILDATFIKRQEAHINPYTQQTSIGTYYIAVKGYSDDIHQYEIEDWLEGVFSEYGVAGIKVRENYSLIKFNKKASSQSASEALNGKEVDGVTLTVKQTPKILWIKNLGKDPFRLSKMINSEPWKPPENAPVAALNERPEDFAFDTIFVRSPRIQIQDSVKREMFDRFSRHGEVLKVILNPFYCFVHFDTHEAAVRAIEYENGQEYRGHPLKIESRRNKDAVRIQERVKIMKENLKTVKQKKKARQKANRKERDREKRLLDFMTEPILAATGEQRGLRKDPLSEILPLVPPLEMRDEPVPCLSLQEQGAPSYPDGLHGPIIPLPFVDLSRPPPSISVEQRTLLPPPARTPLPLPPPGVPERLLTPLLTDDQIKIEDCIKQEVEDEDDRKVSFGNEVACDVYVMYEDDTCKNYSEHIGRKLKDMKLEVIFKQCVAEMIPQMLEYLEIQDVMSVLIIRRENVEHGTITLTILKGIYELKPTVLSLKQVRIELGKAFNRNLTTSPVDTPRDIKRIIGFLLGERPLSVMEYDKMIKYLTVQRQDCLQDKYKGEAPKNLLFPPVGPLQDPDIRDHMNSMESDLFQVFQDVQEDDAYTKAIDSLLDKGLSMLSELGSSQDSPPI